MARSRVKISLDWDAIYRLSVSTANDLAEKGAKSVQKRARRLAPTKTGALRASIGIRQVEHGLRVTYEIGSNLEYAKYQEFGTGPIYPRMYGVLVWQGSDGTNIFARRTSGVPATHFMSRAAAVISIADFA